MEWSLSTRNPYKIGGAKPQITSSRVKKCHVMESCHENDISHQTPWDDFTRSKERYIQATSQWTSCRSLKDSDCRDSVWHNSFSVYLQRHLPCQNRISFWPDCTVSRLVRTIAEDKLSTPRAVDVRLCSTAAAQIQHQSIGNLDLTVILHCKRRLRAVSEFARC